MGKKDKSVEWANWCCLLQRRYIIINHVSITWNISIWKKKENNCRHFLSCAELHIIPCLLSRLWIGQFSPVVLNMIRLLLFGLQSFWIDKAPAHFFFWLFVCLKKKKSYLFFDLENASTLDYVAFHHNTQFHERKWKERANPGDARERKRRTSERGGARSESTGQLKVLHELAASFQCG